MVAITTEVVTVFTPVEVKVVGGGMVVAIVFVVEMVDVATNVLLSVVLAMETSMEDMVTVAVGLTCQYSISKRCVASVFDVNHTTDKPAASCVHVVSWLPPN